MLPCLPHCVTTAFQRTEFYPGSWQIKSAMFPDTSWFRNQRRWMLLDDDEVISLSLEIITTRQIYNCLKPDTMTTAAAAADDPAGVSCATTENWNIFYPVNIFSVCGYIFLFSIQWLSGRWAESRIQLVTLQLQPNYPRTSLKISLSSVISNLHKWQ